MPAASLQDRIVALLRESPAPLGPQEIADRLQAKYDSVRSTLSTLHERGRVEKRERGVYAAVSGGGGTRTSAAKAGRLERATLRVRLFAVEAAADPDGGVEPLDEVTITYRVMDEGQFTALFFRPPPPDPEVVRRFAVAVLRGNSMAPLYFDGEEVPVEVFPEPTQDVPAGALYLVRLDGWLYLKVLDRDRDTLTLKSVNPAYEPRRVRIDDGRDFAVLGRVIETPKAQLYGSLLALYFRLAPSALPALEAPVERGTSGARRAGG